MNSGSYRFRVGAFDCLALSDGTKDYVPEHFFVNAPMEEVAAALRERGLTPDPVTTPYTYLLVDTGQNRVLVDMGAGHLAPTTGRLVSNMEAAGISPATIDTVMITHAHPDHIGGTLDDEGNPVYANARYYIWKEEWAFWSERDSYGQVPESFFAAARRNLGPVRDRLRLVDEEGEVLPGVGLIAAPGHTPGHVVVSVGSGDELLLYVGDTVLHPLHLEHPDWLPIYDILPEQAAESKRRVFDLAADSQALVLGQHFPPFPGLGYVTRLGEGWTWQPIATG